MKGAAAGSWASGRAATHLAPLLLGAMVGAMIAGRIETGLLCAVVALAAARLSGARVPGRRWGWLIGSGMVLALALNLYLVGGRPLPLPALGPLHASAEGLAAGALLALRMAGAAVALHGLRAAWPGERGADEIARALQPLERLRVPVREGRMMVGLALRFAPLLAVEAGRIGRVQASRAGRPPRGLGERLERRRAALVPTLVSALERAEQVALALEARHYRLRPAPGGAPPAWGAHVAGWALAGSALLWRS